MRLSRLRVENYRNVEDLDLTFSGHAVFVGPNASGKSSVLRLVDACLAMSTGQILTAFPPSSMRDPKKALTCLAVFEGFSLDELAALPDEIEFTTDLADSILTVELTIASSSTDPEETEASRVFLKSGMQPIPVTARQLQAIGWRLIQASRNPERDLSPARNGTLGQLIRGTDLGGDTAAVQGALELVDDALTKSESVAELRKSVATALSSVLPQPLNEEQVAVGISTEQNPLRSVDVSIEDPDTSSKRTLLEQSDGVRSLAAMSLRLLGQGGDAMTAVDEPETHLDTRAQARIGRLLASTNGQRILATHSPTVLRQFSPTDVVALTGRGARQFKSNVATTDPKFFARWWVENMIEPLVSRSLILVEGPSDEIIVRRVASLSGLDLDALCISVVDIGGANNFTNAFRLFGPEGFDIQVAALVDKQEQRIVAEVLSIEIAELEEHDVLTCVADLEDEYVTAIGERRVANLLTSPAAGLPRYADDEVLQRCRKYKVLAALGVASGLTSDEAQRLKPINRLLSKATPG